MGFQLALPEVVLNTMLSRVPAKTVAGCDRSIASAPTPPLSGQKACQAFGPATAVAKAGTAAAAARGAAGRNRSSPDRILQRHQPG